MRQMHGETSIKNLRPAARRGQVRLRAVACLETKWVSLVEMDMLGRVDWLG
jgi:hypothetical protein